MARYFIGLDDTDFGESIGTGALARELSGYLQRTLHATSAGITRHQFFIHPDIPYTSHNSSACLALDFAGNLTSLVQACSEFVRLLYHPGADPGLCIAWSEQGSKDLSHFARRAQNEVVTRPEAEALAQKQGIFLAALGGSGLGVIGALCGVALRIEGNDGRFISHRGLRDGSLSTQMTVAQLRQKTAIECVVDSSGAPLDDACSIITNHWIRPDLRNQQVVLTVERDPQSGCFIAPKKQKGQDDI